MTQLFELDTSQKIFLLKYYNTVLNNLTNIIEVHANNNNTSSFAFYSEVFRQMKKDMEEMEDSMTQEQLDMVINNVDSQLHSGQ